MSDVIIRGTQKHTGDIIRSLRINESSSYIRRDMYSDI